MGYLDKLKQKPTGFLSTVKRVEHETEEELDPFEKLIRGAPVKHSHDLARIISLPRREIEYSERLADKWTDILRNKSKAPCTCKARWGYCIDRLNVTQAAAFEELHTCGGVLGIIGVGFGKSGIGILSPMVVDSRHAVLLIPPALRRKLFEKDLDQWAVHFQIPNVTGFPLYYPSVKQRLTVVAYSELSQAKNSDMLQRMPSDLIISDEAHNLKDKKSARTKRFLKAIGEHPARFVALSGTMSSKSIKDYGHLAKLALGEGSPLPLHPPTLEEWAGAIDSSPFQSPAGALMKLCNKGENVRDGFGRRLIETPGVVATTTASVACSLEINAIRVPVPAHIEGMLQAVRDTAQRPDGEEAIDAIRQHQWLREIACGFYYRWIYPRGEPRDVIDQWFDMRKKYFKEVREKLKFSQTFLDSPANLDRAAIRWHDGYSHDGRRYPPKTKRGPAPVWESAYWNAWREVRHSVKPDTEAVWESDYIVKAAVEWARNNTGLIWVQHRCLGESIAAALKLPYYGGDGDIPELSEDGSRCAVLSIAANKDGQNLQKFSKNLVVTPITSGKDWEQMIGRTHRQGQQADTITVDVMLHTHEMARAMAKAIEDARYVEQTRHGPQKLCYADYSFDLADFIDVDK